MAEFSLSRPMRWRFTDADDVAAYGDRWWTWDPKALARAKARTLIEIEETISMPFVMLLEQVQARTSMGLLAALWVSMHTAGNPVVFDEFNPLVLTTEWEETPAESPLDFGAAPTPDSSSSPAPSSESAIS